MLNLSFRLRIKVSAKNPARTQSRQPLAVVVQRPFEQQTIILTKDSKKEKDNTKNLAPTPFAQTYFHGTKADLSLGDFIAAGYNSNFGQRKNAKYIFLAATLDAAIW